MSNVDTFIDEVTEEVRRDRLFLLFKRYGWIAVLAIILLVGGAAVNEYRKASAIAAAENLGDDIIAALASNDTATRATELAKIDAGSPGGTAVVQLLTSAAQANSDQTPAAVTGLEQVASNNELPLIYRQIASFKALTLQAETLPADQRRTGFQVLAQPGAPLRMLAEEQLVLIDLSEGKTDAALTRLQAMLQDAEMGVDLQQRVVQVIVALGGTPELRSGPEN